MNQLTYMFKSLPSVTKNIIIINVIVWAFMALCGSSMENRLIQYCGLHYWDAPDFNPAQLVTYMFLHGGFVHMFFNMFTLFFFGGILERTLGSRRYLFYYITCGLGAGLVQELVWTLTWQSSMADMLAPYNGMDVGTMKEVIQYQYALGKDLSFLNSMITIGASGAVFGLLLAFAMIYPDMPMYLMFIPVPVKAKWMVLGYGVIELWLALSQPGSTVAHFAHLGGMLFGVLLILYWRHKGEINRRF